MLFICKVLNFVLVPLPRWSYANWNAFASSSTTRIMDLCIQGGRFSLRSVQNFLSLLQSWIIDYCHIAIAGNIGSPPLCLAPSNMSWFIQEIKQVCVRSPYLRYIYVLYVQIMAIVMLYPGTLYILCFTAVFAGCVLCSGEWCRSSRNTGKWSDDY